MSEAPPESGGFWHLPDQDASEPDDLRAQILQLLAPRGLVLEAGPHDVAALRAFMASGLFLVQALKWPLAKREGKKRRSFNHLPRPDQKRLIRHSASAHLRGELLAIAPQAILAMGNAALEACRAVSERPDSIPAGGVTEIRKSNGLGAGVVLQGQPIPLDATFLPVDENMRKATRRDLIKADIAAFLTRHGWTTGNTWPAGGPDSR
jgi:hypothetical protein